MTTTAMSEKTLIKDELQEQAIAAALDTSSKHRIVCITGQAGTGKTTVEQEIYKRLEEAGHNIGVAAPTGKAAKRITEITGLPAMTLHRMLEYTHPGDPDPKTGKVLGISVPRRTPENPLEYSVIFVDEYSMVHRELNRALLDAMGRGAIVRMFGDVNQLPPIEEADKGKKRPWGAAPPPSAFAEYLSKFPSVTLKNIYRQGEGSDVVKNAHRILQGFVPMNMPDFQLIQTNSQAAALVKHIGESGLDYTSLSNQIIAPTHQGAVGTIALNTALQEMLQGDRLFEAVVMPRANYDKTSLMLVVGDKVLWTKNDYQLEIFNGESGIVTSLEHDQVTINFGDREVSVPPWVEYLRADGQVKGYDPRTQLKLAYVVTTHAAQGSEYDNVTYVMDSRSAMLQCRPNFYTGVTRAKKRTHVITDQKSLQASVVNRHARI